MELAWKGEHFEVLGTEDYEVVHEADSVIMLPRVGNEVIVRLEPCPAYRIKGESEYYWTPVCGTVEEGEHIFETLQREMGEETPILPEKIRIWEHILEIPFTKLTTQRVSFFFFDVLEHEITKAPGDGSDYEDRSRHMFVNESELSEVASKDNADLALRFCTRVFQDI